MSKQVEKHVSVDEHGNIEVSIYAENGNSKGSTQILDEADNGHNRKTLLNMKNRGNAATAINNNDDKATEAIRAKLFSSEDIELMSCVALSTELHIYAENGNSKGITQILDEADSGHNLKTVLNMKNKEGNPALHIAINHNNGKAIEAIIAKLFSSKDRELLSSVLFSVSSELIDTILYQGWSALELLVIKGFYYILIEQAKSAGELNYILLLRYSGGETALHIAAMKKQIVVEQICEEIKQDKDLQRQVLLALDRDGNTPLHHATYKDNAALVDPLISVDIPLLQDLLSIKDKMGSTATHNAMDMSHFNVAKALYVKIISHPELLHLLKVREETETGSSSLIHMVSESKELFDSCIETAKKSGTLKELLTMEVLEHGKKQTLFEVVKAHKKWRRVDTLDYPYKYGYVDTIVMAMTPVATPVNGISTDKNCEAKIDLSSSIKDHDTDQSKLHITVTKPTNGIATVNGLNVIYTADNGYIGTDSFHFTVIDDQNFTATSTVTLTVNAACQKAGKTGAAANYDRFGIYEYISKSSAYQYIAGCSPLSIGGAVVAAVAGAAGILYLSKCHKAQAIAVIGAAAEPGNEHIAAPPVPDDGDIEDAEQPGGVEESTTGEEPPLVGGDDGLTRYGHTVGELLGR